MAKVLVLYYSAYGHIEKMAYAVAEGAKSAGADVTVKRVPELVSEEVAKASYYKMDQEAEIASPSELDQYDAIIVGAGTRFGTVASQMRNFWDQTGGLWAQGKLVGKLGSMFTSSATQHGGQESTILGFIPTFLHQGMAVVGLPYAFQGQMGTEEVKGGSPYGASTITNGDGSRQPSEIELEAAKFQGAHVAKLAAKLSA
ncbi:NAD(P)H:quinone oxidoreductase type IV [Rhizobium sp. XQZ8]|uniref:NAD(P)H:quinone oxidoreductase type IV n=1 Tax=Rhizobium populisoli TaxID=2859785 RepID=UPI001CA4BF64|nr:NAD(P)H:quinone oxidoreductase type IV [Rhizobium populisoli]MBW6420230.1 NAD(P)H:quinone oxidoreductase type IV [Rhizobium populisoli]